MITINGKQVEEIANKTHIIISKKEYFDLLVDSERLNRLEDGGVDNWEWYGDSLNPDDEIDFCGFRDNLQKEIFV